MVSFRIIPVPGTVTPDPKYHSTLSVNETMLCSASIVIKWVVLEAGIRGHVLGADRMEDMLGEMVEACFFANAFESNCSVGGLEKAGSDS
jgi:hypothetical protein